MMRHTIDTNDDCSVVITPADLGARRPTLSEKRSLSSVIFYHKKLGIFWRERTRCRRSATQGILSDLTEQDKLPNQTAVRSEVHEIGKGGPELEQKDNHERGLVLELESAGAAHIWSRRC